MIIEGDGVRRITAVLLAGQMMTPDKILVAEPCPRQRLNQEWNVSLAFVAQALACGVERRTIVADGAENPQAEACATKNYNFVGRG
jgi:hypothetical protein